MTHRSNLQSVATGQAPNTLEWWGGNCIHTIDTNPQASPWSQDRVQHSIILERRNNNCIRPTLTHRPNPIPWPQDRLQSHWRGVPNSYDRHQVIALICSAPTGHTSTTLEHGSGRKTVRKTLTHRPKLILVRLQSLWSKDVG